MTYPARIETVPVGVKSKPVGVVGAADIELPADTRKSRLHKPVKPEPLDDVATAGERIEAFWERHPDGSILTEVESREVVTAEHLPFLVHTVRAFVRKSADAESPDTTAHATRSEADPDPITAQYAQETAETSAVSRALRNLGILATPRKATVAPDVVAPRTAHPMAVAREKDKVSQKALAADMRAAGFAWTQATVSKIERGTRAITADEVKGLRTVGLEVTS